MRKTIILLGIVIFCFFFSQCSSKPDYKEIAIAKVKEGLLDPNSFELIMVQKDSIMKSDMMEDELFDYLSIIKKWNDLYLEEMRLGTSYLQIEMMDSYESSYAMAKLYKDSTDFYEQRMKDLQENWEALKGTDDDYILEFVYRVRGYATARLGNRVIGDWNVRFDTGYGFLSVENANE